MPHLIGARRETENSFIDLRPIDKVERAGYCTDEHQQEDFLCVQKRLAASDRGGS